MDSKLLATISTVLLWASVGLTSAFFLNKVIFHALIILGIGISVIFSLAFLMLVTYRLFEIVFDLISGL